MTEEQKEALLIEAKRRYPKGTKYYVAYLKNDRQIATIGNPDNLYYTNNYIAESSGNTKKNGHCWTEVVYYEGEWAEIISSPIPTSPIYEIY